jgi:mono/diheme cytochrome c family protein
MSGRRSIFKIIDPFLLALGGVLLALVGVLIGYLIWGGGGSPGAPATLSASEIGNAKDGRELFVSQGCAMCHSFEGEGGTDAPALDFMKGEMTAGEIAEMSGMIWNHVPMMQPAFEEEQIPFPHFTKGQMASLVAYLHGGGPPPDVEGMEGMGGSEMGGSEPGDEQGGQGQRMGGQGSSQMGGEQGPMGGE